MSPALIALFVVGGAVAVKMLSSDSPRGGIVDGSKRLAVLDPAAFQAASRLGAHATVMATIPALTANATPEEMRAAFAAAASRSDSARQAQFKANRAYAMAQMEAWGKEIPYLGSVAAYLASALTWGAATLGNAIADFVGLYDNDWNSDENNVRASNAVETVIGYGLIPDPFVEGLHAGASGYADDLEQNTIAPIQALGSSFMSRWSSFARWYGEDAYRPALLDAQLIRDTNGNPFFPSSLRDITRNRASVMVLGRLVSASRGKDPSLGMAAAARTYDEWSREDRMFNDRAAKRLASIFDAAWNA